MTERIACPKCKDLNRANAKFCATCGYNFTAVDTTVLNKAAPEYVQIAPGKVMNNRYTIERALGKGGMGKVYLAKETIANRTRQVVVKEMLEYFDPNDPEGEIKAHQRFEAEAATLVGLNFQGIPQIFDFFSESGRNYIVMQFIEGRNLEAGLTHLDEEANLVAGEAYPVEHARQWGIQVCKVLENLSALNIVHMDIKPPNLILDKAGDVWLVDFGTAKAQWVVGETGALGMQKSSIYGTIGFAPPEQYTGKAEPRSDVYALASTLYHLMTNDDPRRHPFSFPRVDELPADIAAALKRALNKDVNKRVTAAEFRQLLSEGGAARSTGQPYTQVSTTPPFRWQDGTVSIEPADLVEPANRCWAEALGYFRGDDWENWLRALHRNDILATLLEAKQNAGESKDSPALDTFLRSLEPGMAAAQLYIEATTVQFGAVRRDERKTGDLLLENRGGGWLSGAFTAAPAWLQIDAPRFGFHDQQTVRLTANPARLPARSQPYQAQITLNAGAAGQQTLPVEITVRRPRWFNSLAGRLAIVFIILALILSALAFIEYRWVGWTLTPNFNPLVQGTLRYGILFTSTRDGKQDIYRISGSGAQRITYTPGEGESWQPVPDPQGGALFTSNRDGKREIYRLTAAGTERITTTPGNAESWYAVPDLKGGILFTSNRDGKREIYRLTEDGETVRITDTPGDAESWGAVPAWNGDILFTSNRDGKAEIYRMIPGEAAASRVTVTPGESESLAPVLDLNGDILFTSNRDGQWEVYRLKAGGELIRLTESPAGSQSWTAYPELGGNLLLSSNRDGKSELYRLTDSGLQKVTSTPGKGESYFTPMPEELLTSHTLNSPWSYLPQWFFSLWFTPAQ